MKTTEESPLSPNSHQIAAMQAYALKHESRYLEELKDYLSIPSVSDGTGHSESIHLCARWLKAHMETIGLRAELSETSGNPVVLGHTFSARDTHKPHYLVYGHYDVQSPGDLSLWRHNPFTPVVEDGKIFARGASDNKGQHFAHLKAVEAYLKTSRELPCDITFLIEGEEEVGSTNLVAFLREKRDILQCAGVVVSDTEAYALGVPALTASLRGNVVLEITLTGPNRDLHSGAYGGSVENPAMALCQLLAQLRDECGCITIPGFYDEVIPISALEDAQFETISNPIGHLAETGSPALFGELGYGYLAQIGMRPTLEINWLGSGRKGTIIPSTASAFITMRLVPNQQPAVIAKRAAAFLESLCPARVRCEVKIGRSCSPYVIQPQDRQVAAALRVLKESFGKDAVVVRGGGSIPIVSDFKAVLGVDTLLLGLGLPDDHIHGPNEKFELEHFRKGILMSTLLWGALRAE